MIAKPELHTNLCRQNSTARAGLRCHFSGRAWGGFVLTTRMIFDQVRLLQLDLHCTTACTQLNIVQGHLFDISLVVARQRATEYYQYSSQCKSMSEFLRQLNSPVQRDTMDFSVQNLCSFIQDIYAVKFVQLELHYIRSCQLRIDYACRVADRQERDFFSDYKFKNLQ